MVDGLEAEVPGAAICGAYATEEWSPAPVGPCFRFAGHAGRHEAFVGAELVAEAARQGVTMAEGCTVEWIERTQVAHGDLEDGAADAR